MECSFTRLGFTLERNIHVNFCKRNLTETSYRKAFEVGFLLYIFMEIPD
jgi:hypothetical protein